MKLAWEEIGTESDVSAVGEMGGERHKAGEILAFSSEGVMAPGTDAGALLIKGTGVHAYRRLKVVGVAGVERIDETEFVGLGAEVWEKAAEHHPGFPARVEVPDRTFEEHSAIPAQGLAHSGEDVVGNVFAVVLKERGFVIEAVDVREAAVEEDENDAFGLGWVGSGRDGSRTSRGAQGTGRQHRKEPETKTAGEDVAESIPAATEA